MGKYVSGMMRNRNLLYRMCYKGKVHYTTEMLVVFRPSQLNGSGRQVVRGILWDPIRDTIRYIAFSDRSSKPPRLRYQRLKSTCKILADLLFPPLTAVASLSSPLPLFCCGPY